MTTANAAESPCHTLGALLDGWPIATNQADTLLRGLCLDSRQLEPGEAFVALAGQRGHGLAHAAEAVRRGCAAILHEPDQFDAEPPPGLNGVPLVAVPGLRQHLGRLADRFYGSPSQDLKVLGITGTNGKTSCSHFIAQALSGSAPAGVIGTLGFGIPPDLMPTRHTTPTLPDVHRMLHTLRGQGCHAVAMEASSHGLRQGRLDGVRFRGALFTNFTRDHLDYHGTMAAYLEAKLVLLEAPGLEFVVFDADSSFAEVIPLRTPPAVRLLAYSTNPAEKSPCPAGLTASDWTQDVEGMSFRVHFEGATALVRASVLGGFNYRNTLASLAVLLGLGFSLDQAALAMAAIRPVAGRMEHYQGRCRTVVVDYAHTPDALHNVLEGIRGSCDGRIWLVFGCGGERDSGKRAEMGAVAVSRADQVILTDDNPRSEDGDRIIADILAGCGTPHPQTIRDRRTAIRYALEQMSPGDWLVVAGKGHETTQEINGIQLPFSDRDVVLQWLKEAD